MIDVLQLAFQHHQEGRLNEAETLYRQLLRDNPAHADALHLLGMIAFQRGRHAEAIDLLERALTLSPDSADYHTNLAEAYRASGNLEQAAAHCRLALRLQPDHAEAHNNLALVLQQLGRTEEAITLFKAAIQHKPSWPMSYLNLGTLLQEMRRREQAAAIYAEGIRQTGAASLMLRMQLGRLLLEMGQPEEALRHCQEAVRLWPREAHLLSNLGNVYGALGRIDEARTSYQQAIRLAPGLALPYSLMGLLQQTEGKLDEALAWFSEAICRDPNNPRFHAQAVAVLCEQEKGDEALARLGEVLRRWPNDAEAHNCLGCLLEERGDLAGALTAFQEAARLKPDYADAFCNLGMIRSETGDMDQALADYRQALRHNPDHAESLAALGQALRDRLPAEETAACERLLDAGTLTAKRRAVLQYGLAEVLDARGQFARAAELVQQANDSSREEDRIRGRAYDPAAHQAGVDEIIRVCSASYFQRVRGWGLESEVPVFVLGLPRSGTSLVEQILASHPQVFGAGELTFMNDAYRAIPSLVAEKTRSAGKRKRSRNANRGTQARSASEGTRLLRGVAALGHVDRATVQALAQQYLDRLVGRIPNPSLGGGRIGNPSDALRIVDKMPDNYLLLGLIATLLPRAHIIHVRRDVRDVGLSCWMTQFKQIRWACDLEHIGTRIREYLRLMEHWRQVLPVPMLEIDYEEIVADLEPAARRLVSWCGLEWDPACLAFHKTRRVVRTASKNQVREPLYRRSVGRWQSYQDALAPLLKVLNRS